MRLDSLEDVTETLHDQGYVSDPSLSMSLFLALKMQPAAVFGRGSRRRERPKSLGS